MTWLPPLVAAVLLADALRLRRRLAALPRLPAPSRRTVPLRWDGAREPGDYDLVTADGAVLSAQMRRAATAHARDRGLRTLDLIPADLPVVRALDLARAPDRGRSGRDAPAGPVGTARGAGFAAVVRTGPGPGASGRVVVPCHLTPRAHACRGRAAWLRARGVSVRHTVARSALTLGTVLTALLSDPRWGPVAVIAYCVVPYVVFARTALSPRDLHRTALLRPVLTPYTWYRTLWEEPLWNACAPLKDES
ncbi:hypothetical protein [Actinomadura fibrosa]|uniref:Uncharacterized protein n=1 Tax=Actinomadura fibrosa TaxID=111802 RepID=A0ABW2XU36_9ACTN